MCTLTGGLLAADAAKSAPPPLHQRIDALIEKGNVTAPVAMAGDAEFLRRVWLDFAGTIPTAEEARAFLADADPDKRIKVIDRLLASDEFVEHMAMTLDVWLMERRKATHVKDVDWRQYLRESLAANKSWLELSKEILAADGTDAKKRVASHFYLDRGGEPNLISRDVGRVMFGQDLQCAQCHDHPQISDYLQRDYYGLFAFFGRTYLFQPDKKKPAVLAEKAIGGGEFKSVFTAVEDTSLPRLLHSDHEVADPVLPVGEEYQVAPDPKNKKLQPIPKYSRRAQIVGALGKGENPAFRRNIANRLWAHVMGRGLVEPFDFHHASNPPSHPELLELLANEFAAMNFDLRIFFREVALSSTYQRQFEMPTQLTDRAGQVKSQIDALKAEEQRLAELSRAAADKLDAGKENWNAVRLAAAPSESALAVAEKKHVTTVTAEKKALAALETDQAALGKLTANVTATATGAEAKPDPKVVKLEAAVAAKQKAVDTTKAAVAVAAAEVAKLKPAADSEQEKTRAATEALEAVRSEYQEQKTAWKLAQRRLRDAEDLIAYTGTVHESAPTLAQAEAMNRELAQVAAMAEARRRLANDLKAAADSAQAAREQLSDDEDLVTAAAVLGERSASAEKVAAAADKQLAAVRVKADSAEVAARKLREESAANLESLTDRWADAFAVGSFTQLTPEQLSHSMLRASGYLDRLVVGGEAAFDKKLGEQKAAKDKPKPVAKDAKAKKDAKPAPKPEPPLTEADREIFVADYLRTQVQAQTNRFVALFGGQAGSPQSDFFATADQALFLENDGTVRAWLRPSGDNLGGRLLKLENADELASELYLSVLTREPDEVERAAVADYLSARSDNKSAAVQDLSWALLSSVEFRFKH